MEDLQISHGCHDRGSRRITNAEGKVLGLPYSMEGYGYIYNKYLRQQELTKESLETI